MDIQPKKQPRRPSLPISKKLILFYVSLGALIFAAAVVLLVLLLSDGGNGGVINGHSYRHYAHRTNSDGEALPIKICIDPGHGYYDPGAVNALLGDTDESQINLDIALRLQKLLEGSGYDVIMTRTDSVIPADNETYALTPYDRADFANSAEGLDLFISIHCNSFPSDESVSGTRIYYCAGLSGYTPYFCKSVADGIENILGTAVRTYGMTYDDAFYVVKHINVPSILVECAFISNASDAEKLLSETWRQSIAQGIFDGIAEFTGDK